MSLGRSSVYGPPPPPALQGPWDTFENHYEFPQYKSNQAHHGPILKQHQQQNIKRQVNFKLELKTEPSDDCNSVTNMQKVPSISDLSDPDSSLDIPQQVRMITLHT